MVTALGCFGGDFKRDNGLLLSCSYKMSDILSDKFWGQSMQGRKMWRRRQERPHEALGRIVRKKNGVASARCTLLCAVTFAEVGAVNSWKRIPYTGHGVKK